jgi:fatty-acyl-CoA synthase
LPETLGELLINACRRYGDRVAISARGERRSYAELLERGSRLANGLRAVGVEPGRHVAAMLEDLADAFVVYVGCAIGGYPVVHVNDRLAAPEVAAILVDSRAVALVHTDGLSGEVGRINGLEDLAAVVTIGKARAPGARGFDELLAGASSSLPEQTAGPQDLAIIGYTSGTTGFPKGVMGTNRGVVGCVTNIPAVYRIPMYGRCAFTGTLSFVSGIWGVILPHLYMGGTVNFLAPYTPDSWADHMLSDRSTFTYAPSPLVPALVDQVQRKPSILDSLETVLHSASPLPRSHTEALVEAVGDRFLEVWGMTESIAPLTGTTREDWRGGGRAADIFASVGRALPIAEVWVEDEAGHRLPPGVAGQLVASADTLSAGYYGNAAATGEVFVDGCYRTGDLGQVDDAGYVYVTGRASDLIISGGMNVFPAEVEAILVTMPGVAEAAVFGVQDPRWGEAVTAAVVLRPGAGLTEADIVNHVRANLASYKKPARVHFVDALPRNASMKVQKHVLKERLRGRSE